MGCISAGPSHVPALRKAVFRCGLSGCVRSRPANPKHNLKRMAQGAHMRTLCALRKTQTADVSCGGGEVGRGKSQCTKHPASDQDIFRSPLLPRGTAAPQLGHTLDPASTTHQTPAALCYHSRAGPLTPPLCAISFFLTSNHTLQQIFPLYY